MSFFFPQSLYVPLEYNFLWTGLLWTALAVHSVPLSHSGYEMAGINGSLHDEHHRLFNVNFGVGPYFMDQLFGSFKADDPTRANVAKTN